MVRQLLVDVPIEIFWIGAAEYYFITSLRPETYLEDDVKVASSVARKIRKHLRFLSRSLNAERFQGIQGNDPWRYCRREILAQERSEGHILPLLDIPCRPVVEQHESRDVLVRLRDADRMSQPVFGTGDESKLEFEVKFARR